ncbi:MAG: hypothetical protein NDI61_05745 [Bdellovibrionaceae bacterium]|nr:hypothetical protein [Pseudobdellovibrionaceae bacterium]
MKTMLKCLQTYLLYSFPFVLICMAWGTIAEIGSFGPKENRLLSVLWEILSWNLMAWFAGLIAFLILLIFSHGARESTLTRVANLKERDEREEYVTGRAARAAFISTLSLIVFLLFISIFQLQITRLPAEQAHNGKTGTIQIGLKLNLWDPPVESPSSDNRQLFASTGLPLSKSSLLFLVLAWQLASFHWVARRELVSL